jgi:hypothetical protein
MAELKIGFAVLGALPVYNARKGAMIDDYIFRMQVIVQQGRALLEAERSGARIEVGEGFIENGFMLRSKLYSA